MTGRPLLLRQHYLLRQLILRVHDDGAEQVPGQPVADLVADDEQLREAAVREVECLLGFLADGNFVLLEEDARVGDDECEARLVDRLQPEEAVLFPRLDESEAALVGEPEQAIFLVRGLNKTVQARSLAGLCAAADPSACRGETSTATSASRRTVRACSRHCRPQSAVLAASKDSSALSSRPCQRRLRLQPD